MLNSSEVGCWVGWCWTNLCNCIEKNEKKINNNKKRYLIWYFDVKGEEPHLVFEHVKKCGLPCIIETKEENFGFFLPETEGR